ncbi:hypothetical protein FGADI_5650 [Fusarium gaditjirri]|uniref:N-acetyltransferase domain-containing protein n=1 Tax=Fusarium gaditjirri TaxID=282569 RepID=A0A8H4T9L7_9HYPO|nr:hypothetical protein FGADI_5650 [Fusarium gaditjirri]
MESTKPSSIDFVTVKTTLPVYPLPPNHERSTFRSERLSMRHMTEDDFDFLRALRTDPNGMKWSSQGCPDVEMEQTEKSLSLRLTPKDVERHDWVISLIETGEPIGLGGTCVWSSEMGWPALGYMLLKERWGKGYASEFMKAYLDKWWSLPRNEVELTVDKNTVLEEDGDLKQECISAVTMSDNAPSQNALKKAGFGFVSSWVEADPKDESQELTLHGFVARKGGDVV